MLRQVAKLLFLLILFVPNVGADPITLNGSITVVNGPLPGGIQTEPFVVTGSGFSANIIAAVGAFGLSACSIRPIDAAPPCTSANLSWQVIGTDFFGTFTINGETRSINVLNQLGFIFTSVVFVVPPDLLDASAVEVVAPFSFFGIALTSDGLHADLTGAGTVRLLLVHRTFGPPGNFSGLYLDHAVYTFGPVAPDVTYRPVPEPTTLLLLGSGLLSGLSWKRFSRSLRSQ